MKPSKFPEANKLLLKPGSMTDEECASLPVWTDGEMCISFGVRLYGSGYRCCSLEDVGSM